jgi:TetR/AcrR family transcriptional regulator
VASPKTSSLGSHARLPARARREQLIEVAVDLFSRKGFSGTTTREIAAAAGVTEAIIFRHFETKEQLYTAIIDQKMSGPSTTEWVARLRAAMDRDDDEAVIRQLIGAIINTHKSDPKFERLMLYAALEGNEIALLYMRHITASIIDLFKVYFLRRQKLGALRSVGPDAALIAIAGMAQQYARGKYVYEFNEQCLSDEQALESFAQIAIRGLCVQAETKR